MRCFMVGLDAASLPVLEPLLEESRLPNFAEVFETGVVSELQSQIPPWTASAWPSLYTGRNPGKHGVFDFMSFEGYEWDLVNSSDIRSRLLWEYLSEAGETSVVVNAPVTHPPRQFDGALIPGYLAPESPDCYPEGILDELEDEIDEEYRVYAPMETDEARNPEAKFEDYLDLTRLRGHAFRWLADRFEPSFGFIQFQRTDTVFHDFPGDSEKVAHIYEAVDAELGKILDEHDPDTVVLASDHGIGPYEGVEFRANERLRKEGFVETTLDGRGVPSWFQLKDNQLVGDDQAETRELLKRLADSLSKIGVTHQRVKWILDRLHLTETVNRHVPESVAMAASETVDFESSIAYLRSPSELGIRLNVEGRDPAGVVAQEEYEDTRSDLIDVLRTVETPAGDSTFERVVPREEVFSGPYVEDGPDIVAIPRNFDNSLSGVLGEEFVDPEPYNHKPGGVIALAGRAIDTTAGLEEAHLFDVAPTVLSLFGVPPDAKMDGETLQPVDAVEPRQYAEYELSHRSQTDDEEVEERLADLGYLE